MTAKRAQIKKKMTADEFARVAGSARAELMYGRMVEMAPASYQHGKYVARLTHFLGQFVYPQNLGELVGAETGFIINAEDNVRAPDVAFISAERLSRMAEPEGYLVGAPDLAVEVVSKYDTARMVREKVNEWLAAGTRLVWVVDPKKKTVTVHDGVSNVVSILTVDDTLGGGLVLPGFACPVGNLFK